MKPMTSDQQKRWTMRCDGLRKFLQRCGKAPSRHSVKRDEYSLGKWFDEARRACRQGRLSEDRKEKLEEVVGWLYQDIMG